jgi:hypothetical protein
MVFAATVLQNQFINYRKCLPTFKFISREKSNLGGGGTSSSTISIPARFHSANVCELNKGFNHNLRGVDFHRKIH